MNDQDAQIKQAQGGGGTRPNRNPPRMGNVEHKGTIGNGECPCATDGAMTGSGGQETKGTI